MLSKIFELVGRDSALYVDVCDLEQSIWKSLAALAPIVERHYRKARNSRLGDLGLCH